MVYDTIPACDRRTDRQTDGIAVASTAPAMRRAVKRNFVQRSVAGFVGGAAVSLSFCNY